MRVMIPISELTAESAGLVNLCSRKPEPNTTNSKLPWKMSDALGSDGTNDPVKQRESMSAVATKPSKITTRAHGLTFISTGLVCGRAIIILWNQYLWRPESIIRELVGGCHPTVNLR